MPKESRVVSEEGDDNDEIMVEGKGGGAIKVYDWMGRTSHLMTSDVMEKVRKIVVLTGSMQKTVLKRSIEVLARSEAKFAIQLHSIKHRPSLST